MDCSESLQDFPVNCPVKVCFKKEQVNTVHVRASKKFICAKRIIWNNKQPNLKTKFQQAII